MASEALLTGDIEPERLVTNHCPRCEAAKTALARVTADRDIVLRQMREADAERDAARARADARGKALEWLRLGGIAAFNGNGQRGDAMFYPAALCSVQTPERFSANLAAAIGVNPALLTGGGE